MKQLPPSIRKQIIEAWLSGSVSERQLAEQFNITKAHVGEIIGEYQNHGPLKPVGRQTLNLARELYNVMPTELAGQFARRFEAVSGANSALLLTPRI